MEYFIIILVCFAASTIGSVCGIGGGVIIKPVLDALGIIPVDTISFLSGCTVLSMSVMSVIRNLRSSQQQNFDQRIGTSLAVGAVIGGIVGKSLYQLIIQTLPDTQKIGAIQAFVLLIVTLGTLFYTMNKSKITTRHITSTFTCIATGTTLGIMSAFLGIGGGPINLVVLFYFFSLSTKQAAIYSLYIIMFSQTASLFSTLLKGQIPEFSPAIIMLMVICGVLGGLFGSKINRKIDETHVDKLFVGLMVVIIIINLFNIAKYR